MAFFEGWGVRSWPGGRGGRPRALVKEGQVQGRVGLLGSSTGGGKGSGESKGFGSGRVGVLFFESWRVDLVRVQEEEKLRF